MLHTEYPHQFTLMHRDAEFMEVETDMEATDARVYDESVHFWRVLKKALEDVEPMMAPAGKAAGAAGGGAGKAGGTVGGGAGDVADGDGPKGSSKDVWKSFWSCQQRFFKLLCVSMKVRCLHGWGCRAMHLCLLSVDRTAGLISPFPLRLRLLLLRPRQRWRVACEMLLSLVMQLTGCVLSH